MKKLVFTLLLMFPIVCQAQTEEGKYYIYNIVSFVGDFTKENFKVFYDDGVEVKRLRNEEGGKVRFSTPGRYVGIADEEDDGEPFEEKMQRLTSELGDLFSESHRLENEIKKQLGSIGFGIQ